MEDEKAITRTGPHTPEAKAAIALNNLRHGLRSTALVIPGREDPADWQRFSRDAFDSLAPVGVIEAAFAYRIAELLWRMRRVSSAEHQMVVDQYDRAQQAERRRMKSKGEARNEAFYESAIDVTPSDLMPRLLPRDRELQQVIRYEAHLSRQLYQAIHELEALQARRSGNPLPLARIEVHGLPEE